MALDNFFMIEPIPYLHEFEQKIKGYDELRQEICIFRNKVNVQSINTNDRYILIICRLFSIYAFHFRFL